MYQIDATILAYARMSAAPGQFRARLQRHLLGIAETAQEVALLQDGFFPGPPRLRLVLDGFDITYVLDHEARKITIEVIQPDARLKAS